MVSRVRVKTLRRAQQGNQGWATLIECVSATGNGSQLSTSTQGQHTMQSGIGIGILNLKPSLRTQIMARRKIVLAANPLSKTRLTFEHDFSSATASRLIIPSSSASTA